MTAAGRESTGPIGPKPGDQQPGVYRHLSIVGAIAAKDIGNALKNRTTLTTIVVVPFLMVFYRALTAILPGERGSVELWFDQLALAVLIMMFGALLAPNLMLEETETRTQHALLVSPAGSLHIVAAKALAGLSYTLTGLVIWLAFGVALIIHWGLAILALVLGSLFGVALGLQLGAVCESRQQLTLWGFIMAQPLILPPAIASLGLLPDSVTRVLELLATVALGRVLALSVTAEAPQATWVAPVAVVALWTGGLLVLVAWRLNRSDR